MSRIVSASIMALGLLLLFVQGVHAATVTVTWNQNTESDVAGYKVYYGTAPRSQSAYANSVSINGKTSTTAVLTLSAGTYYFAVTARDTAGNESAFSTEVNATVPSIQPPGKPGKPVLVP
jgi:fibronectin type 3 domain-containing protein